MTVTIDVPPKNQDFKNFLKLFLKATEKIEGDYFQLPAAGAEDPLYRERVYCYELYHRIREQMPDGYSYKLDGELDRLGHPLRGNSVGGLKPDFLVHSRGVVNSNLAAIAVKPINTAWARIIKDVETLCGFLGKAGYYRAIYLLYGADEDAAIGGISGVTRDYFNDVPRGSFYIMRHRRPGTYAHTVWVNE